MEARPPWCGVARSTLMRLSAGPENFVLFFSRKYSYFYRNSSRTHVTVYPLPDGRVGVRCEPTDADPPVRSRRRNHSNHHLFDATVFFSVGNAGMRRVRVC